MEHTLKTWPPYFNDVLLGRKTFECRFDDRGFNEGHKLILKEWLPTTREHTGRCMKVLVTRKWASLPGISPGYCIMQIKFMDYWSLMDS